MNKHLIRIPFVLFIWIILSGACLPQTNNLTGRVVDASTGEPLIGANVIVNELPNTGAAADEDGFFSIKVPVGAYSIKISLIGYIPVVKTDIIVNAGRETFVNVKLQATAVELGEITVKSDYFDKAVQANNLSTVVLSAEEVRRSPGSMQDFQRILQAMPGVANSSDQTNELLVRGGSPNENLTVFDNIEIHSTNHYPNQFNSGGPINMVNVDLIDNIQFSTGGFTAKYGDKLSSVMVVNTREGRRNSLFNGNINVSFAGAGGVFEGGFGNGKGSWLLSLRKSYLDLIVGAVGLTAVPHYYDGQFKVVYDLSDKHKLMCSGIYGNDKINISGEPGITNLLMSNSKDSIAVENVDVKQHQYAGGISLKSIWSKNVFSLFTVSASNYFYQTNVLSNYTERNYNQAGRVFKTNILTARTVYDTRSSEGENTVRGEINFLPDESNHLNFGFMYKDIYYKNTTLNDADTARYDLNVDGIFEVNPIVIPPTTVHYYIPSFSYGKTSLYLSDKIKFFNERLLVNVGGRYDYFSYSKSGEFSPRFSASYYLVPSLTSINLAWGLFYQTQAYPFYGDRYQSGINQNLKDTKAVHYILGLEQIMGDGLKLNIEAYYKKYSELPYSETFIHFNDRTFRSERIVNKGERRVYGVDLVLQQKLVKDIYGTLSLSYMNSKEKDPRLGKEGNEYSSDYEYPFISTIILGKRFSGLRSWLNDAPFFIKYPSYILPFSNDMEISIRWRYSSGRPTTPRYFSPYEQHREGGITWSGGTWIASGKINSERLSAYHRLDLAFNSRFNFNNWNLVIFLSLQNIYNRKNVAGFVYNDDGTIETVYQFSFLPVLGLEVEF